MPPERRTGAMPWPDWPMIVRTSTAHEEGVVRDWSINTKRFIGENGALKALEGIKLEWKQDNGRMVMAEVLGSNFIIVCELVLLALAFLGPKPDGIISHLRLTLDPRTNVLRNNYISSAP